jgi:hypothetical protein
MESLLRADFSVEISFRNAADGSTFNAINIRFMSPNQIKT